MADNGSTQHWAKKQERGSLFGIYFLVYVFKIFGSMICKIIMTPVLFYFYVFNASARNNIKEFLIKVNGYNNCIISASQWNVLCVILNFGYGVIDKLSAWTGRISLNALNSVNDEEFRQLEKQGKGAILLVSHLGNFEICRVASELRSPAKFNIFMHTKNSKKISKAMNALNPKYDLSIIQGDELDMYTVMLLKEKVDAGEFVVIAGDRVPVKNNKGIVEVDFLGSPAKFAIGPFVLAKVLKCPIITLYCLKNKNKYDVFFNLLIKELEFSRTNRDQALKAAVETYAKDLETYASKAPLQWYNFHPFWTNDK